MSDTIDITGLPKHKVFQALFNGSKQQGLGFMNTSGATAMTERDAQGIVKESEAYGSYFDYVRGRVMKVDLSKDDEFFPGLYDRDNGPGAAAAAIDSIR